MNHLEVRNATGCKRNLFTSLSYRCFSCTEMVLDLQWRRLAVQALHLSVEDLISTRPLLVWRCRNWEDDAHGHVLRAVVSICISLSSHAVLPLLGC